MDAALTGDATSAKGSASDETMALTGQVKDGAIDALISEMKANAFRRPEVRVMLRGGGVLVPVSWQILTVLATCS